MVDAIEFEAGSLTFEQWLAALNAEVERVAEGMDRECFRDWHYADAYEDGVEPVQAAHDMLAEDVVGAEFLKIKGIEGGL